MRSNSAGVVQPGRRRFIRGVSAAAAGIGAVALWRAWPEQGFRNACHAELPARVARHPVVDEAWNGLDPAKVWDAHAHLVGTGDSGGGAHVSAEMTTPANPRMYAQYLFYLNAGCVHDAPGAIDATYVARLQNLVDGMRRGFKVMLFAFDAVVAPTGQENIQASVFHVPNAYTAGVAARFPQYFEWVASIHPYRADCVERLDQAVQAGARAVKWLPNAMAIDPADPRCDRFYAALARHRLPLITHAGHEAAVHSPDGQRLGNPLRLRRPLEAGVRVVIAHCATLGSSEDLDVGPNGPVHENFVFFSRLMDEPRYLGRLFGDVSAVAQRNRAGPALARLLERKEWHARLLNGSDYPLPGILPLFSIENLVAEGFLTRAVGKVLRETREHNPLLFDFVLKRHLRSNGHGFEARVFETREFFVGATPA